MSDNFSAANSGAPVTFSTKEVGGIHTPRNLIEADGQDVGTAHPLPVSGPLTDTQLRASPLSVDLTALLGALAGTLSVEVTNPTNLSALLSALAGTLQVHVDNPPDASALLTSTQYASGVTALLQVLAGALTVHVDNQPTQPLTDTQLRAGAVTVHVDNQPTQPLTDTQLRAGAVTVHVDNQPTQIQVSNFPATAGAETNRSGNVATANQALTIMAANAGRKYFELQNLSLTDFLWFRKDGQPAAVNSPGSFALGPASSTSVGGFYSGSSTSAVSVVSVTAGHPFSAVEV